MEISNEKSLFDRNGRFEKTQAKAGNLLNGNRQENPSSITRQVTFCRKWKEALNDIDSL